MELNELQKRIMVFIKEWADTKKTTIPQREILIFFTHHGVKSYTTLNAINSLLKKGFIRRAYNEMKNRTFYVMIRNI